jgi:hypothetical protein
MRSATTVLGQVIAKHLGAGGPVLKMPLAGKGYVRFALWCLPQLQVINPCPVLVRIVTYT